MINNIGYNNMTEKNPNFTEKNTRKRMWYDVTT